MSRFGGKIAFISGGASGMGLATAQLLVKEGAKVVIGDINWELAQKSAASLGGETLAFKIDQADPEAVERAIAFVLEKFGRLDLAVNAAGIAGRYGRLESLSPKDIQTVFAVNLQGAAYLLKHETTAMNKTGGGAIVNIASTTGVRPTPFLGIYSTSKSGVISLTKFTAVEEGPNGIRVNCISPGYVDTPMLDASIDRGWIASVTPNRRCGKPEDIADAAAFLLSDAAKQITGVNLPVDGGQLADTSIRPPGDHA